MSACPAPARCPSDYCPDLPVLLSEASLVLVQHGDTEVQSLALRDVSVWLWLYETGIPKCRWLKA